MRLAVSLLYSAYDLVTFVAQNPSTSFDALETERSIFTLAETREAYAACSRYCWLSHDEHGIAYVTERGKEISATSQSRALVLQIQDIIGIDQPAWSKRIPYGRREAVAGFPDEVKQVFKEAGLLDDWSDALIEAWDTLAHDVRLQRSIQNMRTGRDAERLSVQHEHNRTGEMPKWLSLETNFAGFDLLSIEEEGSHQSLKIEVKGTTVPLKSNPKFFVSRNEWDTAQKGDYQFHLWNLSGDNEELAIVSQLDLEQQIPQDQNDGRWRETEIPFRLFF